MNGSIERLPGERFAVQRTVGIAVKETSNLVFEFAHPFRCGRDQLPCQFLVRQPLAALDGVHEMALHRVADMERDVVPALNHPRAAAFADQALGHQGDVQSRVAVVGMQRREQAGAAGAQDQNIGLKSLDRHGSQNTRIRNAKATTAAKLPAAVASLN